MPALKNVRILKPEELKFLVDKYIFELQKGLVNDFIIVTTTNCARKVLHSADESFTINTPIKRITIVPDAIKMWQKLNFEYNLIEVQNAINILTISYQDITKDNVLDAIENKFKISEK